MAGTYHTHADVEPLLDDALDGTTTPTDALVDALTEQTERLASGALGRTGYTLAQADALNSDGLKGILIQITLWLLDDWYRRQQAGGAESVTDSDGTLMYSRTLALPREFRTALTDLVHVRPSISTLDTLPSN